jgi:uncharacterized protein YndB with AHSA1/START domain
MPLAIVAIVILAGFTGLLVYASTRSDTINIRRSANINAPPERIFALINDFHQWPAWAPQDKMDPTMARTFSGPARGKGASSQWTSKGRAGRGRMEITESDPPGRIVVTVDFETPFKARNINEFALEANGATTRVTWSMRGPKPFIAKIVCVFVDMDRLLGKHFEAGLQALNAVAES